MAATAIEKMRRVLLKSGENRESEDRLSNLPDCVLRHILSSLDSKSVVQTCVLSKRWKFLWKSVPTLKLHASRFRTLKQFTEFVSKILTLRDGSITLRALDLVRQGTIEPSMLKRILRYACYDKTLLEKLGMSVRGNSDLIMRHVSLCKALTSLKLSMNPEDLLSKTSFPKSLDLPTLTSLDLTNFAFCGDENRRAEPFLRFTRLNSLSLRNCTVKDAEILNLSSETLVNLAIHRPTTDINIAKIELYAPNLSTFTFTGSPDQKICGTGLSSASLDLPTLTSLDLTNFVFCGDENRRAEPFLRFTRLNCLSLRDCTVKDAEILNLSSETLVNLAIHRPTDRNIAIKNNPSDFAKIELYAPNLSTFTFTGSPDQKICGTGLSSAKQVNIHAIVNSRWEVLTDHEEPPMVLLSWLQDLVNVKSMTLSSTTLQILFLIPDLSEVQLPSLCNLKSMKIEAIAPINQLGLAFIVMEVMLKRAAAKSPEEAAELKKQFEPCWRLDPIPDGVLNFLIQNSPSTNIDIIPVAGGNNEYLKKIVESIKGAKIVKYRSQFAAPGSSSTTSASAAASVAAPASAAPPNLHLCRAEKGAPASASTAPASDSVPASSFTSPAAPASSSMAPVSASAPASSSTASASTYCRTCQRIFNTRFPCSACLCYNPEF